MYDLKDILEMLGSKGEEQERLFERARRERSGVFADAAVVRGVIEVTNRCRINCEYCPMRKDNFRSDNAYLMTREDILEVAGTIRETGIGVVFLQGGEIPQTTPLIGSTISEIKKSGANIEVLLCLGNKKRDEYRFLRNSGADSYIIKIETGDPVLHKGLRHASFDSRLRCLSDLLELGFRVGTGIIIGLPGQTLESIAKDILLLRSLGVDMASVSPFMPAPNTPLENRPHGSVDITLNAMAVMRLLNPRWLIPSVSALEKLSAGGQLRGMEAGANVLTINFTPSKAKEKYLIYGKDRCVTSREHVFDILKRAGLTHRPAAAASRLPAGGSACGPLRETG
jgi:biotin synthase